MTDITVEFEFEIGDLVYFRSALHCSGSRPQPHLITERVAQECHGGIQRLYRLDTHSTAVVSEIALCRDEPEYKPISDGEYKTRWDEITEHSNRARAAKEAREAKKTEE